MEGVQDQPTWLAAARWMLQAMIPVVLVLTSVRLLLTRSYIRLEYSLPGFPPDRYGLTQADRLAMAPVALDYLLNDSGIEFLASQTFPDGSPAYNERELRHMADVKLVVQRALGVWRWGGLLAIALGVLIWRAAGAAALGSSLVTGGRLTLWTMLVLFVGLVLAFSLLFVGFHQVFFDAGTWTFAYSDTLIRLFPERFWQVAFATVALSTGGMAGLLWIAARRLLPG